MKKIIIPSVIAVCVLIAQGYYILKLRHDLDKLKHDLAIRKTINEQTIMQVLDRKFEYAKNEDDQTVHQYNDSLDEPDFLNDYSDIVKRIEMLEMHLDYKPSKKWIKDVLVSAKNKLEN